MTDTPKPATLDELMCATTPRTAAPPERFDR